MSGDVQPRKRKDKKKRKDEGDGYGSMASNDDVTIHVQKDGGTGGNICSKIVFFFLFSALIVLIGLIIKENQGLNELDNIESESRFSQIFEGWIDKTPDEHEDHSPELHDDHDDHEEEDDEAHESEELEEETEEDHSQEADDEEEQELEDEGDEDSAPASEEEDDVTQSEEDEKTAEESDEADQEEEDDDGDDTVEDEKSEEKEESKEQDEIQGDEASEEAKSEEVEGDDELKAAETEDESKEQEAPEEPTDAAAAAAENEVEQEHEAAKENSNMATKIGVGVALLVVAYNVFLRKRRSDVADKQIATKTTTTEKEPTPDLSRRNTLIPPPSLQEVEPDLPDHEIDDEEYSEEEYSDEDAPSEHRTAREEYQELRTAYTRSMTPEGDFEPKNKKLEEDVLVDELEEEEEEEEIELEEELEEEEIDDDYEKYDEDEDEELLKRLEAKYGKLGRDVNVGDEPESDSDKDDYEHSNISNKEDYAIREDIDAAQQQLDKNAAYANKMFEALLDKYPLSPRSLYGKARALDILAEERQSNELLKRALNYYSKALDAPDVPDPLFVVVADRFINRARFMGQYKQAISAHWQLIHRFPETATYLNNLAVTYLTINMIEEARSALKKALSKWPSDGFALVHYGFILKTADNNLEDSVEYMSKGLHTKDPGVIDGRFFYHLGDALTRLNRNDEAIKLYKEGVKEKIFMSTYQRSLYNVDRLLAKPWWEPQDLPSYEKLFAALKENWHKIRQEGLSTLNEHGYFEDEAENLKDTGTWKQLELFARGRKFQKNCERTPVTCGIIQKFSDARGCKRGQTKFSVMHPGTHVWPHCGPTNCRLRIHLGLKVPPKTFIRVAEETRSWKEGDIIIFDDSFEHEVWHNGSDFRLVLIVDVWHPQLTPAEKKSISSI